MMRKFLIVTLFMLSIVGSSMAKGLPEVRLRTTAGKTVNTAKLITEGKPTLVVFFALWCKPCMLELKALGELYQQWQELTGVQVIAVSIDDARSTDKVSSMVRANGYEWTTLLDTNSELKRAMGVNQIPHMFLLDTKGEIAWQHTSYSEGSEGEILKQILSIVNTKK